MDKLSFPRPLASTAAGDISLRVALLTVPLLSLSLALSPQRNMLLGLQDYVLLDRKERDRREDEPAWKRDARVSEESEDREGESCREITREEGRSREREQKRERERDRGGTILMSSPIRGPKIR